MKTTAYVLFLKLKLETDLTPKLCQMFKGHILLISYKEMMYPFHEINLATYTNIKMYFY